MKPWVIALIVCGGAAVLCCGGGALWCGSKMYQGYGVANTEATAFADKELPLILKDWNSKELMAHASPELVHAAQPEILKSYFDLYQKRLGKFEKVGPSKVIGFRTYSGTNDTYDIAVVSANASFYRDNGVVRMELIKRKGEWRITTFIVDAKIFETEKNKA